MKLDGILVKRLEELLGRSGQLIDSKTVSGDYEEHLDAYSAAFGSPTYIPKEENVNEQDALQWSVSSMNLIERITGKNSLYYERLKEESGNLSSNNNLLYFERCVSVIKALKNDYENGYLFDTRALIEAEVFDDFLEQAEQLLDKGYFAPAAVVVGSVLEDGLRKLCDKNSIVLTNRATIDPMNIELVKSGLYNALQQKKITALADLRNKAAHGKWDEFDKKDVEDMIRDVRRFMEEYFS